MNLVINERTYIQQHNPLEWVCDDVVQYPEDYLDEIGVQYSVYRQIPWLRGDEWDDEQDHYTTINFNTEEDEHKALFHFGE